MTKLIMRYTRRWLVLMLLLLNNRAIAQTQESISLSECQQMAKANYPAIVKLDLVDKTNRFDLQNANRRYLPQVSFSGQTTYQSQTISFPDALGGLPSASALPDISKDQYKIQGEINQVIYDGGNTRRQKELIKANSAIQEQNIEVTLYALKQRVNNLFFSVLLMDAQLAQNELNKANLQTQVQKMEAALSNGVAFRSNVDELKAEVLNIAMMNTEYKSNRIAYLNMLSLFIGKELPAGTRLDIPDDEFKSASINRPEIKIFDLQKSVYSAQEKQLRSDYMPQVNAFFQGAYGRPTLNIIENKFGPWYMTGIKLNWSLGSLYTLQNKKKILDINRRSVDADKDMFLLNTQIDATQQDEQYKKYQELLTQDTEAIALRQSVTKSAEAQLTNGVITTHEYIQKVNAEHLARQNAILHGIQLLQTKYNQQFITGNQ